MINDQDPRLTKIIAELDAKKSAAEKNQKAHADKQDDTESMSVGMRAGAELVTAVFAGGFIGYWLDQWLTTKPFFLIAMLVLGVITGFVNVWRTTQGIGYQVGNFDNPDKDKKDDKKGQ